MIVDRIGRFDHCHSLGKDGTRNEHGLNLLPKSATPDAIALFTTASTNGPTPAAVGATSTKNQKSYEVLGYNTEYIYTLPLLRKWGEDGGAFYCGRHDPSAIFSINIDIDIDIDIAERAGNGQKTRKRKTGAVTSTLSLAHEAPDPRATRSLVHNVSYLVHRKA